MIQEIHPLDKSSPDFYPPHILLLHSFLVCNMHNADYSTVYEFASITVRPAHRLVVE